MFFLFKKKKKEVEQEAMPLTTDMHSHLLPSIDDGAENLQKSIALAKKMADMGYTKLITTPHVMQEVYTNSTETILQKLSELRQALAQENISLSIDAAAEYYLDEGLVKKLANREALLTFGNGKKYLLFETSFMNPSPYLESSIFDMQSQGYTPILAHPERYVYLFNDFEKIKKTYDRGVLFQLNINSLAGYYSGEAKRVAEKLIDNGMVQFLGTDCHGERHLHTLAKTKALAYYKKALKLPLLNHAL